MNKYYITFSVVVNKQTWTWEKIFYSSDIERSIENYLKEKEYPFNKKDIKWNIKSLNV